MMPSPPPPFAARKRPGPLLASVLVIWLASIDLAVAEPSVAEIVDRTNATAYYQGKDGRATVEMTIVDKQGRTRTRKLSILRRNDPGGKNRGQRYYVYFHAPADLAKTVFMVHKHIDRDDDRWLYLPALDLVKRIAATDKRTSFVGSDFVYEDVSGRSLDADTHKLLETTKNYYVLEHTPKDKGAVNFARYTMHVHRTTFLPTRVEYYDAAGKKIRMMTVDGVETIGGYPTVTKATMHDLAAGSKTTVTYSDVRYDLDLPERIFTERYLRRPPQQHLK
ncbi:MAG: outer membrane lipoprotein-sorting protein [Myxococcales bacterium]|nr:outer membrane lipoprotein-sorting protein [Myxococcales bacterium]